MVASQVATEDHLNSPLPATEASQWDMLDPQAPVVTAVHSRRLLLNGANPLRRASDKLALVATRVKLESGHLQAADLTRLICF